MNGLKTRFKTDPYFHKNFLDKDFIVSLFGLLCEQMESLVLISSKLEPALKLHSAIEIFLPEL